jgi:tRNA1(Val) A37 N6-methylase TrmN6
MTDPVPVAADLSRFHDGAFAVLQPRDGGHRAGLDALLLAAAVPAEATGVLADFGAGVGVAGLAAIARAPDLTAVLVERDPATAALARASLALPETAALAPRARVVEADLTAPAATRVVAGLSPASADWVILNPPFHPAGRVRVSPADNRRAAHVADDGDLDAWLRAAAWALKPAGRVALIYRADALAAVLAALAGRFGALVITPVHPRAGEAAHRIVVTGRLGSRALPIILPGLVLHPDGSNLYLPEADAILRGRAGLSQRP